jgi:pre-rRNA-processing protein IPI3
MPNFTRYTRQPISTLCISLTTSLLLVGTSTGVIHVYDIPSHQLLRSILSFKDKGLSITHLATLLKPPDLIGHISLSLESASGGTDAIPVKPVVPFHRMRDVKSREAHEISILLPIQHTVSPTHEETVLTYTDISQTTAQNPITVHTPTSHEFLREHAFFVQPPSAAAEGSTSVSLESHVTSLEAEVSELREQLGKAKGVNDAMWETIVQKVIPLANGREKGSTAGDDEAELERRRKRGRV